MNENLNELPAAPLDRARHKGRSVNLVVAEAKSDAPTEWVPIGSLLPGDSPRLGGENRDHVVALVETDAVLPPIVVHRGTMRVIDGMHRVSAAKLKGHELIEVRYFDGSPNDAFVMAVETNIAHGLPLSLADRRAAAARIVTTHPTWSDRAIAAATGIAPGTVATLRSRSGGNAAAPIRRIGLDGRAHPVDAAAGRRVASQVIALRPDASLREIARMAGVSAATARDVRERISRAEDPVTPKTTRSDARRGGASIQGGGNGRGRDTARPSRISPPNRESLIEGLRRDPALRMTDSGRELLRWLLPQALGVNGWRDLVEGIPPHCVYLMVDVARSCANEWSEFARQLEARLTE
jgi:ParB-like nuclease domain